MDNIYYFITKDDQLVKFEVQRDDLYDSPREIDNLGKMCCWHNRYNLGDFEEIQGYDGPEDYINMLVRENFEDKSLVNYIRNGKASNNLEIKYNRSDKVYELIGDYMVWWNGNKIHHGEIANQPDIMWLSEDIIDALPMNDKLSMLERKGFIFLPLAIYDHSGITMWCGSKWNHFDAQWDCSDVGFIYTKKEDALKWGYSKKEWKKLAESELKAEVETYDMYLQGNVYGYQSEIFDGVDWNDEYSCWGFYSNNYGNELAEELSDDVYDVERWLSEDEANEMMKRKSELVNIDTAAIYI